MDNKKRYLDKVVDFLVQDTVIDYGFEFLTPPFSGKYSSSYSFYTFVYPFWDLDMDITPDLFPRSFMVFRDYVNEEYGLTEEESKRVWEYYWEKIYTTIRKYFNPINESVDRKKEFLNKVAHFIVDDSVIEYEDKSVKPPFTTLWFDASYICNRLPHSLLYTFFRYCEDAYNLNSVETNYVWEVYSSIICDKLKDS